MRLIAKALLGRNILYRYSSTQIRGRDMPLSKPIMRDSFAGVVLSSHNLESKLDNSCHEVFYPRSYTWGSGRSSFYDFRPVDRSLFHVSSCLDQDESGDFDPENDEVGMKTPLSQANRNHLKPRSETKGTYKATASSWQLGRQRASRNVSF